MKTQRQGVRLAARLSVTETSSNCGGSVPGFTRNIPAAESQPWIIEALDAASVCTGPCALFLTSEMETHLYTDAAGASDRVHLHMHGNLHPCIMSHAAADVGRSRHLFFFPP